MRLLHNKIRIVIIDKKEMVENSLQSIWNEIDSMYSIAMEIKNAETVANIIEVFIASTSQRLRTKS